MENISVLGGGKIEIMFKGILFPLLEAGGTLSTKEFLYCRIRYFSSGLAVGGKSFVENVFESHRSWFSEKRTSGARKIRNAEESFFCLRDLRKEPISPPE